MAGQSSAPRSVQLAQPADNIPTLGVWASCQLCQAILNRNQVQHRHSDGTAGSRLENVSTHAQLHTNTASMAVNKHGSQIRQLQVTSKRQQRLLLAHQHC